MASPAPVIHGAGNPSRSLLTISYKECSNYYTWDLQSRKLELLIAQECDECVMVEDYSDWFHCDGLISRFALTSDNKS